MNADDIKHSMQDGRTSLPRAVSKRSVPDTPVFRFTSAFIGVDLI
jgi:hypothetical protein